MLTQRRRAVLDALVNEYISSAIPVGSRTLTERYGLGVSPATVRNELAGLEHDGFVISPHTSAGRIPTDSGYRMFVNGIMLRGDLSDDREIAGSIIACLEGDTDDVFRSVCSVLSRVTSCFAIASGPHRRYYYQGIDRLLMQPEFHEAAAVRPIFAVIEDGRLLADLLADVTDGHVMVRIGRENIPETFGGVSIVAQAYASHEVSGFVAVMGPTRMDYACTIPAVSAATRILDEVL